jgi:tRNA(Ile)-lysidine synthase
MNDLVATVADCLRRHSLWRREADSRDSLRSSRGMVAVSGGPDSVALALVLRDLPVDLTLAHLNHLLRGAESDADEAWVTALAEAWDLPCRTARLDVAAEAARTGGNLEETARCLRYEWLTQIAHDSGATWVATGHTADDQAETVLHRLLRGSGLQGLRGMAERRPLAPGIDLVRPLLHWRRADVLAYLEKNKQAYRLDSSNADPRFTRNRLRHELLPLLTEHYSPALVDLLGQLAGQAAEAHAEIASHAVCLLADAELPRAGNTVVLRLDVLAVASRYLRREALRLIWQREPWPSGQMTYAKWDVLARMADEELPPVDLPGGVRAQRAGRVLQLIGP